MERYESSEGTSNKFWEIRLEGCSVRAIVKAPIVKQRSSLDLSMGTMTNAGTRALIDGADSLAHLASINVERNAINDDMTRALETAFSQRINIGRQSPGGNWGPYVSVGE